MTLTDMQIIDYKAHDSLTSYLSTTFSESSKAFQGVFDCVGSDELFRKCSGYLDKNGVFITIVGGVGAGPIARSKLLPVSLGGVPRRYKLLALWPDGDTAKEVAKWVEEGLFTKYPIDSEYAMGDAVQVRNFFHSILYRVTDLPLAGIRKSRQQAIKGQGDSQSLQLKNT